MVRPLLFRSLLCVAFLWPALARGVADADAVRLATVDSLIHASSFGPALDSIDAKLHHPDLGRSLQVQYRIRKLTVLRNIDQWQTLILLSKELLSSGPIGRDALVRIRLLRAVAFENMGLYLTEGSELDCLDSLFAQGPKGRAYGEYLYRRASFHRVQEQPALALEWAQRAIVYNHKHGYVKELASSELVMGLCFKKKDPASRQYLLRSAQLNLQAHDPIEASIMFGALAARLAKEQPLEAKAYLYKAMDLMAKGGPINRGVVHLQASRVYGALGQLDSALYHLKAYDVLRDSSELIKQGIAIRVIEEQHFQEQLTRVRGEKKNEARIARQFRSLATGLALALLAIVVLSVILWRQVKRIKGQHSKLRWRQTQLNALLADKEVLLRELHHRVKNQLTTVVALIDHQLADKDSLSKERLQGIQQRIHAIARVHERLLNGIGERSRLNSADVEDIIHSLISISSRPVDAQLDVDLPELDIDLAVPLMMILNELIANTIKHGATDATGLRVHLAREGAYVVLRYADNGTWKEPDLGNEDRGTGRYIIEAMVRQLHGDLERTGTAYVIRMRFHNKQAN